MGVGLGSMVLILNEKKKDGGIVQVSHLLQNVSIEHKKTLRTHGPRWERCLGSGTCPGQLSHARSENTAAGDDHKKTPSTPPSDHTLPTNHNAPFTQTDESAPLIYVLHSIEEAQDP